MNAPNARILGLLTMVDEAVEVDELSGYLTDPDPEVRRTALSVLSEGADDWDEASPVFANALLDVDVSVRVRAADLLRELREVLSATPEFADALRTAALHADPLVRQSAIGALWRHHLAVADELGTHLGDDSDQVRREVVFGLVSLDDLDLLAKAAGDASSWVRITVARGIGSVADPRGIAILVRMYDDPEPLVRAAALAALGETGCTDAAAGLAVEALEDKSWEVRQAAATALASAAPEHGVDGLVAASTDENLDVRKAAVKALATRVETHGAVREALLRAQGDADADVRAFARIALEPNQS